MCGKQRYFNAVQNSLKNLRYFLSVEEKKRVKLPFDTRSSQIISLQAVTDNILLINVILLKNKLFHMLLNITFDFDDQSKFIRTRCVTVCFSYYLL